MKNKIVRLSIMLFTIIMMTACGTADINDVNDRRDIMDVNNPGDSPFRNDPEYNDLDNNNMLDSDRDDTIMDDEDINVVPNGR